MTTNNICLNTSYENFVQSFHNIFAPNNNYSIYFQPDQDNFIPNHNNNNIFPNEFSNHNVDENIENIEHIEDDDDEGRYDLLRKKLKTHVLKNSLKFINDKIRKKGYKIKIKKVESSSIKNQKIDFEKKFMYKTLGDIFSSRVSCKYTSGVKDHEKHNKTKIDKLKSKDDKFKKIFDIKYIECLNHFIGKDYNEELIGMKTIQKMDFKNEKEKQRLINFAKDYEIILLKSRARKSSKAKKNLLKKKDI